MFQQIKYFQSVVRNNSFSEAAEECHISQSAVSQQIQALERELGFQLLFRIGRKFELTPAGEYFYKKTLVLTADYERICVEASHISQSEKPVLRIGYLRNYCGLEFSWGVDCFHVKYPHILVEMEQGDHEDLFEQLRLNKVDLVFSDQRRAFSDTYENYIVSRNACYIEISARNPIGRLESVSLQDLKNTPCIVVSSKKQEETERDYYREVIGVQGNVLFAENLEQARLLVIGGNGFFISAGETGVLNQPISRVPLYGEHAPLRQTYCVFWKKSNTGYYMEEFAYLLKQQFEKRPT